MKRKLKILFVEDNPYDAELIWKELGRNNMDFDKVLVDTRKDFISALTAFNPDIVVSDYSLPQFDGLSALKIRNEHNPRIPFILVTGSVNETTAVELMKEGADDYIIKKNLSRLGQAIFSAIEKKEVLRKKEIAEMLLRENEERFRILFEKAPVGYQSLDETGNFIEVNETWCSTLGYTRDEVVGKWFGDFLASEFRDPFRERFELFKKRGKIHSEFEMVRKDGVPAIISFEGRIGHTIDGKFKQTHCVLQDVTNLRRTEKVLTESEERFRLAVTEAPVPIMIHDEDDKVLMLSKGWTTYSGYSINDIPTLGDWTEAAYGQRTGQKKDYIDNLFMINKTTDNGEWVIKTKSGDERVWDFHTTPLGRVNEGKRVLLSLAIDITEQKKNEAELKKKIDELEKFNDLTVDRELKMVELKKEINSLLNELGKQEKYKIVE